MCSGPWPASGSPCDAPRGMVRGSACGPPPFAEIRTDRGSSDNPLWAYFDGITEGPVVDKWKSYFDVYHRCQAHCIAIPLLPLRVSMHPDTPALP